MKAAMKQFSKYLGALLLRVVIAVLVGTLLLTAVYCIPQEAMEENVRESAQVLYDEGLYPWLHPSCTSMVDNFTDTFMLMHAAYRNEKPAIQQAMNVYRPYFEVKDMPYQDMVDHYIEGKAYQNEYTYERYWHGYLVYLKPALCVMNYATLRKVNGLLQTVLLAAVVFLLAKAQKKRYIPACLLAVALLVPTVLAVCLQYSSCYYAILLGSLALLLCRNHLDKWEGKIFLYIGIFVAFFDFLTYPIATLGVPAALYFALRQSGGVKEDFGKLTKLCFSWCVGYGGMWGGKWVLGSLITGNNQLTGAMDKVQERTDSQVYGEAVENPVWKALTENRDYFCHTPVMNLVYVLLAVLVVVFLVRLVRKQTSWQVLRAAVPFAIIALMPIVWYAVLTNHSIMHAWFTNKALVTMAFALLCLAAKLTEKPAQNHG